MFCIHWIQRIDGTIFKYWNSQFLKKVVGICFSCKFQFRHEIRHFERSKKPQTNLYTIHSILHVGRNRITRFITHQSIRTHEIPVLQRVTKFLEYLVVNLTVITIDQRINCQWIWQCARIAFEHDSVFKCKLNVNQWKEFFFFSCRSVVLSFLLINFICLSNRNTETICWIRIRFDDCVSRFQINIKRRIEKITTSNTKRKIKRRREKVSNCKCN